MKVTQKELAKEVLRQNRGQFIPTWKFVGEINYKDEGWYMMSYKCPARLSEIYQEYPGKIERRLTVGKSGAKYYEYKLT